MRAAFLKELDEAYDKLNREDLEAKNKDELVGRYIEHPYADGAAIYKIVKVFKRTVRIESVPIGDAWTIPAWGDAATISLDLAKSFLHRRDALASIFS